MVAHVSTGQRLQNYLNRVFDLGKVDLVLLDEYQGTVDALLAVKARIRVRQEWGHVNLHVC